MNEALRELKDLKEIKGTFFKLHPLAVDEGGMGLRDEENKIPQALKELM